MAIRVLKLVTGEEIIGEVSEVDMEGTKFLRVQHPVSLLYKESEDGSKFSVGMAPFAICAKDHIVPIFPGNVISVYDPVDHVEERWIDKYGKAEAMVSYDPEGEPEPPQFLTEREGGDDLTCTNIDAISNE